MRISVISSRKSSSAVRIDGVGAAGEGFDVGRDKVRLRGVVADEICGFRRTCRAHVQALRRCVKQLRPSFTRISCWSRRRRRAFRSSAVLRRVSPTPSGLSKRNGSLLFEASTTVGTPSVAPLSSSLPDALLTHSSRSLQSSSTRLSWLRFTIGVPGSLSSLGHVHDQSSLTLPANILFIASFCFIRSLLVRSAS